MTADPPQAHHLFPADRALAAVDEGFAFVPMPRPPAALAGRWELAAPLLIATMAFGQRGVQPGIVPQAGQEFDAGRAVLGQD